MFGMMIGIPKGGNNGPYNLAYNFAQLNIANDHKDPFEKCSCPQDCLRESIINGVRIIPNISREPEIDIVYVRCSNVNCPESPKMHRECFEHWQRTTVSSVKSCGRARNWSDKQINQNIWKKGYDLAYKITACRCGRGSLRKDLDRPDPLAETESKKSRQKNRNKSQRNRQQRKGGEFKIGQYNNNNNKNNVVQNNNAGRGFGDNRMRANSGCSVSSSGSLSSNNSSGTLSPTVYNDAASTETVVYNYKRKLPTSEERSKSGASGNGIFSTRTDHCAFNFLPRVKINSVNVKMEDDGNHGSDETHVFVLSNLASLKMGSMRCVLCNQGMEVFSTYPLINGTFFLSPRQYSTNCFEVKYESKTQFLTAVCLLCLEGRGAVRRMKCMYCAKPWSGSYTIKGTMYAYDVFAANPCCPERFRCNNCRQPVVPPSTNFSAFSQAVECHHCGVVDTHFVKPLNTCYSQEFVMLP